MSLSETDVVLTVRVVPRSSRSEVVGMTDGVLKVRIAAPPVDGAANAELTKVLAKEYGIARADVEIVGGATSRTKRVRLRGVAKSRFEAVLKGKS